MSDAPNIARGKIGVDFNELRRAREVVVRESRMMVGEARKAHDAVAGMSRINFNNLQNGLRGVADTMKGASAAAAAFTGLGLAAAQRVQRLNALMTVFAGSQEKANERMAELRAIADRTGQSFLDLAEGATTILPVIGRQNVDLSQTLSLVQRLALLDPMQGVEGAAFALRELLGGEYMTLTRRFEMPRQQLQEMVKAAEGDPQKIIEGLDAMVEAMGLTNETFEEMSSSGINAFSRMQGVITEAMATAFTPALNDFFLPAATMVGNFISQLNNTSPAILSVAGTLTVLVAGIAPLAFGLNQAISAGRTLVTVMQQVAATRVGGAAGVGIAGALGVGLGVAGANLLANNTDLQTGDLNRIRGGEDAGAILMERLKQILGILVLTLTDGMIHLVKVMATGAAFIYNAIDQVVNVFKMGGAMIGTAFGAIQEMLGSILMGMADNLSGLFDTTSLRESGRANVEMGQQRRTDSEREAGRLSRRLAQGFALPQEVMDDIDARTARVRETVLQPIADLFAGAEQAAEQAASTGDNLEDAASAAEEALSPLEQALQEHAEAIDDTARQVAEITADFERETKELRESRGISDTRDTFDYDLRRSRDKANFDRDMARSDAQFYANQRSAIRNNREQMAQAERDYYEQRNDIQRKFAESSQKAAEEHGKRLEKIQRDTQVAVADAAARLDARAVFEAQRGGATSLTEENNQYRQDQIERQQEMQQRLTELRANYEQQRSQRQSAFAQQLAEEQANYEAQRAQRIADWERRREEEQFDRELRLQRLAEDRAREDRLRQEAHTRQIQNLHQRLAQEMGLNNQMNNVIAQGFNRARQQVVAFVGDIINSTASMNRSYQTTGGNASRWRGSSGSPIGFAAGGRPRIGDLIQANERGMESALINNKYLAAFTQPATIFNAQQTAALMGGSGGQSLNWSGNIVLGDVGNRSNAEIEAMIVRGLDEGLRSFFSGGAA